MKTLLDTLNYLHAEFGDTIAIFDGSTHWYIPTLISESQIEDEFEREAYCIVDEQKIKLWENDGFTDTIYDVSFGQWNDKGGFECD